METPFQVTAIVLAAGRSQRMGTPNKLLAEVAGHPVLARVIRALADGGITDIVVVTGSDRARVAPLVRRIGAARLVHNPAYRTGMAGSIRCGVQAAGPAAEGYAVCPGDLPLLTGATVRRVGAAFGAHAARAIVQPHCHGRPGHPVVFDRSFRQALLRLEGDGGARPILQQHPEAVVPVAVNHPGIYQDVDTPNALRAVRERVNTATGGAPPSAHE